MFSKFFDWLKKKEKCESKRDFEKVDIDNANEININTSTKANCEIVKDLTTNVVSNDSVIKNSITKENFTKENFAKSLFDAKERLSSMREIYYATNIAGRIIKKVLDRGIAVVQWDKNSLGDLSGNVLEKSNSQITPTDIDIIMKCLSSSIENRYSSCEELLPIVKNAAMG